ncbi:MAG: PEP-CTERM sorting domain-containing protein [Acidobacteria bacterium]|nr:PEP-CTERM sorting domain-containing protein [Acidobacteriota bacterium]MCI0723749.1 PEP-CTERM sorting domain-containing protein [Acidobacteriota bacterium]
MKKISLFSILLGAVLCAPLRVKADSISLTQTFGDLEITNTYTYAFGLSSVEAVALSLDAATLSLTHQGNSNNSGEVWLATSAGGFSIGTLSSSTAGGNFVTDSWVLSAAILSEMTGQNPWTLTVHLHDNTTGTDKITIKQSVLNVDYAAKPPTSGVPEPATALLLATGTMGMGLLRRQNK